MDLQDWADLVPLAQSAQNQSPSPQHSNIYPIIEFIEANTADLYIYTHVNFRSSYSYYDSTLTGSQDLTISTSL